MTPTQLADFSEAVRQSTLKRLAAVPPGWENWPVAADCLSFAEIARHLAAMDRWLLAKLADESLPSLRAEGQPSEKVSAAEYQRLLDDLAATGRERAVLLRGLSAAEYQREITDDRFGGRVTVWWVIMRGNLDHEIHHRGQLALGLKLVHRQTGQQPDLPKE
ncbi:MAG: DinB family protein [Acidobacteria bacterium]|nr:DinB family protein [Acidobacteriota bacterium]